MIKKITIALLVCATTTAFAMSINEVNKASKEELMKINGIGEKKADAIIEQRKNSSFKSFEDLETVKGVGPSLSKNIQDDVLKKAPTEKKDTQKDTKKSDKKKSEKSEKSEK